MSQDFYIKQGTGKFDWTLQENNQVILCPDIQSLTRQRVAINLKMIQGEWFANRLYGVPYLTSITGKNTKNLTDSILKRTIRDTDGITSLDSYSSTLEGRTLKVVYSATTESGVIKNEEVVL